MVKTLFCRANAFGYGTSLAEARADAKQNAETKIASYGKGCIKYKEGVTGPGGQTNDGYVVYIVYISHHNCGRN